MLIRTTLSFLLALLFLAKPLAAQVTLENVASGETLRTPTLLLRGRAESGSLVEVRRRGETAVVFAAPVVAGRFIALVQLEPGQNRFTLEAGGKREELKLEYVPAESSHELRVLYVTAADKQTDFPTQRAGDAQDYKAQLEATLMLLQAFTAETLNDAGFGRLSFQLELSQRGRLTIHTLHSARTAAQLRELDGGALFEELRALVEAEFGASDDKRYLLVTAFSDFLPDQDRTRAAIWSTRASLTVVPNLAMCSWPSSLADMPRAFTDAEAIDVQRLDDERGRKTLHQLASATVGRLLHELVHGFGLEDNADPRCIMSHGSDNLRHALVAGEPQAGGLVPATEAAAIIAPALALRLAHSPWFRPDPLEPSGLAEPELEYDAKRGELTIRAKAGVDAFSVHTGAPIREAALHRPRRTSKKLTLDLDELREELGVGDDLVVTAYDRAHRKLRFRESVFRNSLGYLREWHVSQEVEEWQGEEVPLPNARAVKRLAGKLGARRAQTYVPSIESWFQSYDLYRDLGQWQHRRIFLLSMMDSERTQAAQMRLACESGARIWINGELVYDDIRTEVISVEGKSVDVTLRKGKNEVLVQSFQATGGWGISLRFVDAEGAPLVDRR